MVLTNWPEDKTQTITLENHPDHPEFGTRSVTFSREIYVEQDDFMENPPKKYFRLFPGNEVRLKGAYIIRCDECVKNEAGEVVELHCTVDLESASGTPGADRKVKGTLHWVSAADCVPFEARLYEPLLTEEMPEEETEEEGFGKKKKKDFISRLNPNSITTLQGYAEPCTAQAENGTTYQFLRNGYFCKDPDSTPEKPVYNRTVGLKDTWAKLSK